MEENEVSSDDRALIKVDITVQLVIQQIEIDADLRTWLIKLGSTLIVVMIALLQNPNLFS